MTASADLLRRAAAKLRGHADQAVDPLTGGEPWTTKFLESSEFEDGATFIVAERNNLTSYIAEGFLTDAHAWYIALMHPPVALALADWLDRVRPTRSASYCDDPQCGDSTWDHECDPKTYVTDEGRSAIAVARAILREPEETS